MLSAPQAQASAPNPKATVKSASPKKTISPAKKKYVAPKKTYVAPKKKVAPTASPSPAWPPKNFATRDGIYAKVPSRAELVSIISAQKNLANAVNRCEINACGAVLIAAITGCGWWEIDSTIYGPATEDSTQKIEYGFLKTLAEGTKAKKIATVLLISSESLVSGVSVGNIIAKCWPGKPTDKVPSNSYLANIER
jgi:hypothetical protein